MQALFFIVLVIVALILGVKDYTYYSILWISLFKDPILLYFKGHEGKGSIEVIRASLVIYLLQVVILSAFYELGQIFN